MARHIIPLYFRNRKYSVQLCAIVSHRHLHTLYVNPSMAVLSFCIQIAIPLHQYLITAKIFFLAVSNTDSILALPIQKNRRTLNRRIITGKMKYSMDYHGKNIDRQRAAQRLKFTIDVLRQTRIHRHNVPH